MKRQRFFIGILVALLSIALAAGLSQAQGPELPGEGVQPQGEVGIQAAVGSYIPIQGRLTDASGNPLNGTFNNVSLRIYNAGTGGSLLCHVTPSNLQVSNGLFSTSIPCPSSTVNGQQLYLAVKVGSDAEMTPRQPIYPVPYAFSLKPGANIIDNSPSTLLFVRNDGAGIGVYGWSFAGIGVYGHGLTYGVSGNVASPDGYGGYFENNATGSGGVGLYAKTSATGSFAVWGDATATTGYSKGVYGLARSPGGVGVMGYALASTGGAIGVEGETNAPNGSGVQGWAFSTSGGHGVYANSRSPGGAGAALWAENTNVNGIAIWGKAQGDDSTMILEHKAGSGDFIRAFETDPSELRFRFQYDGRAFSDLGWSTPASDFAEMLPATSGLEPGDVLVIGPDGKLTRSAQPYQSTVVGVYSTQPGFVGGQPMEGELDGYIPLAVVGVVPVKASAENGPIRPGDLLVASSLPGHAMKAEPNPPVGTVIGKALEGLDSDTGVIKMLVMLQ